MKNLIKTVLKHKVLTSIFGVCLVAVVGVGLGFGLHQIRIANTEKALKMAEDGVLSSEELEQLGEIALGDEVTAPDGSKVVITMDENGNYIVTPVAPDAPVNPGGGDTPEPTPTPEPAHVHVWVAHKTIVHHPEVSHKVGITCCSTCGADVTNLAHYTDHKCNGGHYSTFEKIIKVVDQAAWDQEVVDYYYCSECGARQ